MIISLGLFIFDGVRKSSIFMGEFLLCFEFWVVFRLDINNCFDFHFYEYLRGDCACCDC